MPVSAPETSGAKEPPRSPAPAWATPYLHKSDNSIKLYVLYFIPVIRVIPVVYLVDRLNKIVVLNEYKINQAPDRLEEVNE